MQAGLKAALEPSFADVLPPSKQCLEEVQLYVGWGDSLKKRKREPPPLTQQLDLFTKARFPHCFS